MSEERWLPVPGYIGKYLVSDLGRVKKVDGTLLSQWPGSRGYSMVRLSRPRVVRMVHRLVALAFIPNPDGKPYINHIDNSRDNNAAENLEWCTQAENLRHASVQGRMRKDHLIGRRPSSALLSDIQVKDIRSLYATGGWSWEALGRNFLISKRAVGRLIHRETYRDV